MAATVGKPSQVKIHTFYVPTIDEFQIPDADRVNRQLIEDIRKLREDDDGVTRSNVSGWHSSRNLFERTEQGIMEICRHFVEASAVPFERYFTREELKTRTAHAEGWVNINPPHAYNQVHTHDRFDLSGVYFVKVPERSLPESGCLQFLNPGYRAGPYSALFKKMNPQSFTYTPIEGRMLVFPSTMPHWVLPNSDDEDRISIAFNITLQ